MRDTGLLVLMRLWRRDRAEAAAVRGAAKHQATPASPRPRLGRVLDQGGVLHAFEDVGHDFIAQSALTKEGGGGKKRGAGVALRTGWRAIGVGTGAACGHLRRLPAAIGPRTPLPPAKHGTLEMPSTPSCFRPRAGAAAATSPHRPRPCAHPRARRAHLVLRGRRPAAGVVGRGAGRDGGADGGAGGHGASLATASAEHRLGPRPDARRPTPRHRRHAPHRARTGCSCPFETRRNRSPSRESQSRRP